MAMRTEVTSGTAAADGADLYFERRGDGPPLLLIVGGGGDCGYYSAMADLLASEYTVVSYDRRGNSRSPRRDRQAMMTVTEQGDDAVAVLRANGFGAARIFGNSGGATIALDLAAHHPQVIEAVVAHEPPVPRVLPDPADTIALFDEMDRILAADGWRAAFAFFQIRVGGMRPDRPEALAVLLDPAQVLRPGPLLDLMTRVSANWEYMTTREVQPFVGYEPDLDRIAASQVRIALAYGAQTRNADAIRMSLVTAERLGVECAELPGGHTAPMEIPRAFAAALCALFGRL
jgi:pimeloyl-ACP methyl ester carboxylesterase